MALVQNESDIVANELTLRQVSSPFAESTVRPNNALLTNYLSCQVREQTRGLSLMQVLRHTPTSGLVVGDV